MCSSYYRIVDDWQTALHILLCASANGLPDHDKLSNDDGLQPISKPSANDKMRCYPEGGNVDGVRRV